MLLFNASLFGFLLAKVQCFRKFFIFTNGFTAKNVVNGLLSRRGEKRLQIRRAYRTNKVGDLNNI